MTRQNEGPEPASGSGSRPKQTARENWIAVIVLGLALGFIGATLQLIPFLSSMLTLVLTIFFILGGVAVLTLGVVRFNRNKNSDESNGPSQKKTRDCLWPCFCVFGKPTVAFTRCISS